MSILKTVKKTIRTTPFIGTIYLWLAETSHYPEWRKACQEGRRYMTDAAGEEFEYANPLRLDVLQAVEIHPRPRENFFQYNPTICLENNGLRMYWRVSNWCDCPDVDSFGRRRVLSGLHGERLVSRTATGFLPIKDGLIVDQLSDEGVVTELDPESMHSNVMPSGLGDGNDSELYYEDPRVLVSDPTLLALIAYEKRPAATQQIQKNYMALFDRYTKSIISLKDAGRSSIEKNWVLAKSTANSVTLLRQSNPHHLVEVDRRTGALIRESIQSGSDKPFLNGGTTFVLVDNSYYLRVARRRISLPKAWKIHVSHIVKHDLEFNEICRSKPFIFRKFAYEICNGLDFDGDHFFFSWGENDQKIFVGSVPKTKLLEWLEANLPSSSANMRD